MTAEQFDLVVVGGTPAGLTAAIAAARAGLNVVVLERTRHAGGLPANGLGATDIGTRGATGGLFLEFIRRVHAHYVQQYGADSPQVHDASDGYHFEPSVGAEILLGMVAEHPRIAVRLRRQFDAAADRVTLVQGRLAEVHVTDLNRGATETYAGGAFIDATYEGDLAAACGVPFKLGREAAAEFHEPMAGVVYKPWGQPPEAASSGAGDDRIQAYNYRLCLTARTENRVPIPQPPGYDRAEYASLADDVAAGRWAGTPKWEAEPDGVGRLVNLVTLPNGKTDANNQHLAFLSTDLPEENQPWPTADWAWRDGFAARLRNYTLGLLYFAQHDAALPTAFRAACARWGLAADEYADNQNFPRQVYVREGRRMTGRYRFTAHDALPLAHGRPPIHADSVTASHYALDSHAVRKREPGHGHLDGFFSYPTRPYTVPYRVMVPETAPDGLLFPVAASATHVGFSTLRMEPCWMALGEAAGAAAALAAAAGVSVAQVPIFRLQQSLLDHGAVLIHYADAAPGHSHFRALQWAGLRGLVPEWTARLDQPVLPAEAEAWSAALRLQVQPRHQAGKTTRGEYLTALMATQEP